MTTNNFMKYAHVKNLPTPNTEDNIVKTFESDSFDAANVAHKFGADKEIRIIPVVKLPDPVISDPLTERLGSIVTTVEALRVTRQRSIKAIPQEEQDDRTERETIKGWYQTFRDGNATNAQAQKAIARLIKEQYGS